MSDELVTTKATEQIKDTKEFGDTTFRALAKLMSSELSHGQKAEVFQKIREWSKDIERLENSARDHLLKEVLLRGETSSEKGSKRLELDEWVIDAQRRKDGYDDKKIAQLLNEKMIPLERGMNAVVSYVSNKEKLILLMAGGKLTQAELDSCLDTSYVLKTPHKKV